MPKKLEDCVRDVKAKGGVDNPWAVCVASTGEKPHKEKIEEAMMREIIETKLERGSCGCQKKKTS